MVASGLVLMAMACANRPGNEGGGATNDAAADGADPGTSTEPETTSPETTAPSEEPAVADVIAVGVSGSAGDYSFAVTLRSPDTGCDLYADWWEVLDADGTLLSRRILTHSHVDEQPFTRSGGPIEATADAELWVRAHMHGESTAADGYGGQVLHGTPGGGFEPADGSELPALHEQPPLPDGCAF